MQLIDQDTDPIKPQPFALLVEIKVGVMHSRVREGVQGALVRFLDGLFVPGRVDEVDEELVPVERDLLLEMPAKGVGLRVVCAPCHQFGSSRRMAAEKELTVAARSSTLRSGLYLKLLISAQ